MNEFLREQFVTKEVAQQLRDVGYSEDCFGYYQNAELIINALSNYELDKHNLGISAPLWQQVIDWLREKHDLHIEIGGDNYESIDKFDCYRYLISKTKFQPTDKSLMDDYCKVYTYSYTEARQAAIEHALTLI
jgi:hypothetical protein